jgi:hypothetical protein
MISLMYLKCDTIHDLMEDLCASFVRFKSFYRLEKETFGSSLHILFPWWDHGTNKGLSFVKEV